MNQPLPAKPMAHNLILEDRNRLSVSGILEIVSFEEHTATIVTSLGTLVLGGDQFRLIESNTGTGELLMEGTVSELYYIEPQPTGKKRLFGLFGG